MNDYLRILTGLGSIDRNGNDATHTKWIIKDKLSNKYEKEPSKMSFILV